MRTALIIVPAPAYSTEREGPYELWNALMHKLKSSAPKAEGVLYIAPNVFVIPFDKNVAFLGELIQNAKHYKTPFQMLLLDEPPEWIHADAS
jgi:hypothetical protein